MAKIQFPLQFERQYSNPIDIDMVFETTSILDSYLTDVKRYAGMIVTCKEQEGKIFVLNNAKDEWLTFDSSLYEKTANKVTSFNTPTDIEYPSAKLVKEYVDSKVSTVYKPQGSVPFSSLVVGLLVAAKSGFVYNITDAFTTNDNFVEGAGKSHSAGTNVVIIEHSGNYKFDVLGGTVDLTPYELLSNKVSSWSSTTDNTRYPSEKLVKDSLEAISVGLENIENLSPLRFAGYFTGGTGFNDFNNLIRPFENLTNPLPDFYVNNVRGAMFVCSAASEFDFHTVYYWSLAEGTGKITPITFNWAAPYDEGIGIINFEIGDTISILNFAYDTVENEMFILIKVEKNSNVKADKVIPTTTGNIPKLNASGNLEDSGFKLEKSVPSNAVFTDTVPTDYVVKNSNITAATKTKITYDAKGLVTAGDDLTADDIPTHNHTKSEITDFPTIPTIPDITVNNGNVESGKYISQVAVDGTNKHKLNITKENLPTIPSKISDLTDDSDFATETYVNNKVSSVYKVKGTVANYSSLPSADNVIGDVWNLTDTGANYVWDGSAWDKIGDTVDLSAYAKTTDLFSKNYNDLTNKPTIPTVPTISTDIETDATSDIKTASPKAVKTYVDNTISTAIGDIETLLEEI